MIIIKKNIFYLILVFQGPIFTIYSSYKMTIPQGYSGTAGRMIYVPTHTSRSIAVLNRLEKPDQYVQDVAEAEKRNREVLENQNEQRSALRQRGTTQPTRDVLFENPLTTNSVAPRTSD